MEMNAEFGNPDDFNNSLNLEYFTKDLKDIYIAGTSYDELVQKYKLRQDLSTYLPLQKKNLNSGKSYYLGYYLPWHPQNCYYFAVENGGFNQLPKGFKSTYRNIPQ